MTVSVIIPCYNLGVFLPEAIQSVYDQTYKDWELIVVDDGSTDDKTTQIISKLRIAYPDTKFVQQANTGLANTRNNGIKLAQGKYIVCLDADDVLAPTYLEKTVALLQKDTTGKVAIASTWLQEFGERSDVWKPVDFDLAKMFITNQIHAGSMFKKEVWDKTAGYRKDANIHGHEDWEFWLQIIEQGFIWKVVPEALFKYRIRGNSMLRATSDKRVLYHTSVIQYHKDFFLKHYDETLNELAAALNEQVDSINQKNASIGELQAAVEYQKSLAMKFENDLEDLNKSRILVYAQRLVRLSIKIRHIPGLRYKFMDKLRAIIPKPVKNTLVKIKRLLFPIEVRVVENQKWADDKPLISVVTPYFNQASTISETIDSILSQTFKNFEMIIVNDGSDETNTKALQAISSQKIQVIHHKTNLGKGSPAAARNTGVKAAQGKYIVCIDADDAIELTYLEKALNILECDPMVSIVTPDTQTFGETANAPDYTYQEYNPLKLISDNMVITAAVYRKEVWEKTGGYKSGIGYEDWEFWLNAAEHGYFGKHIPEKLFRYRIANSSRFLDDRKKHDDNISTIRGLHPEYENKVRTFVKANKRTKLVMMPETQFVNLNNSKYYTKEVINDNVLIVLPWMTFGGAETLILNFCSAIKHTFNLSFVTGLESDHEWEDKFKLISPEIYHLADLYDNHQQYLEFLSNYVATRNIKMLHIVHTHFIFDILPELKRRHPELKVLVTLFNDRAHFDETVEVQKYVESYSSDNNKVVNHFKQELKGDKLIRVIPNGINSDEIYNPELFDRDLERAALGLADKDLAVFFVGRMSPEKNPDVFIDAAKKIVNYKEQQNVKFFLIGDGPMGPDLQQSIRAVKGKNISYLGYKSDIAKHLSAADIFVLPSSVEGFPMSILEAMAMKVAIISSDVGAVSDVLTNNVDGVIITPGSESEIIQNITRLNSDRAKLESIKVAGQKTLLSKYTDKTLGKNYTQIYSDTINSRNLDSKVQI